MSFNGGNQITSDAMLAAKNAVEEPIMRSSLIHSDLNE
jgi:hypothetical protein